MVELTAIDVQRSEINVVWRLPQPLTWNVMSLRPVSEFQNNMPFVSRDPLLKQILHGKPKRLQQIGRRPIQRLAYRIAVDRLHLDTQNPQARIGEMNRCRQSRKAATNHRYIKLICLVLHGRSDFGVSISDVNSSPRRECGITPEMRGVGIQLAMQVLPGFAESMKAQSAGRCQPARDVAGNGR